MLTIASSFQLSCGLSKQLLNFPLSAIPHRRNLKFLLATRRVHSALFSKPSVRYAILGAGFAGLSVAWHLLQFSNEALEISVDVFDEKGIGAGASGVSGGLLHPYTPKGKLVWNGVEAWKAALELLNIADAADKDIEIQTVGQVSAKPMFWQKGILRPPASQKHCADFRKFVKMSTGDHKNLAGLSCIDGTYANTLLPGLAINSHDCALYMTEGLNIDPLRYMQALWRACEQYKKHGSIRDESQPSAVLKKQHISSLACLEDEYDAVIICLGAGVNKLEELEGELPLIYCRGVVTLLVLPPGKQEEFKYEGPSILGDTWIAAQGPHNLILGATKDWDNCDTSVNVEAEAAASACHELISKATTFYPPITNWSIQGTRAGVRAMAPRTLLGKVPLVGCIDEVLNFRSSKKVQSPYYWILGGLGSRGLIYHAWLGKKLAEAVVFQNEACLPREVLQWRTEKQNLS